MAACEVQNEEGAHERSDLVCACHSHFCDLNSSTWIL